KLGMISGPLSVTSPLAPAEPAEGPVVPAETTVGGRDIKSFVTEKSPKSDVHFAATVAYYCSRPGCRDHHPAESPFSESRPHYGPDDPLPHAAMSVSEDK